MISKYHHDILVKALSKGGGGYSLYVNKHEFGILQELLNEEYMTCNEEHKIKKLEVFLECVSKSGKPCPTYICFPGQYDSDENRYLNIPCIYKNKDTRKSVYSLLEKHDQGGKSFFKKILESYNYCLDKSDDELINIFFDLELFNPLCSAAIKSKNDKFLKRIMEKNIVFEKDLYNDYFQSGNLLAIKMHIEKHGVNAITNYYGPASTALYYARNREIAHFLLKNGADPNYLVLKDCIKWSSKNILIPKIKIIRWCLEYDITIKNIITAEMILNDDIYGGLDHKCSQKVWNDQQRKELDYIKLLRDFNYVIPEHLLEKYKTNNVKRSALITYQYVKVDKLEKISPKYLRWNIATHRHFDADVKKRVFTCLLCFRRICWIPKDVKHMLLEVIFFEK